MARTRGTGKVNDCPARCANALGGAAEAGGKNQRKTSGRSRNPTARGGIGVLILDEQYALAYCRQVDRHDDGEVANRKAGEELRDKIATLVQHF